MSSRQAVAPHLSTPPRHGHPLPPLLTPLTTDCDTMATTRRKPASIIISSLLLTSGFTLSQGFCFGGGALCSSNARPRCRGATSAERRATQQVRSKRYRGFSLSVPTLIAFCQSDPLRGISSCCISNRHPYGSISCSVLLPSSIRCYRSYLPPVFGLVQAKPQVQLPADTATCCCCVFETAKQSLYQMPLLCVPFHG